MSSALLRILMLVALALMPLGMTSAAAAAAPSPAAVVEVSRFNGREPDQHRCNIETAPLDSTSVRLSWNSEHGSVFTVGKVSLGAARDFKVADHLAFGVGGLMALNFVPRRPSRRIWRPQSARGDGFPAPQGRVGT
jgi:hypothetical protein